MKILPVKNGTSMKMSFANSRDALPLYRRNRERAYWAEYLNNTKLVYFQYNQCVDLPDHPFRKMQSDLENMLAEHSNARLVVDIRNNSGGDSSILDPFISSLKDNPRLNCKGRLFVVTGR